MMSSEPAITRISDAMSRTRIRAGRPNDLPAIARLLARAHTSDSVPRIDDLELAELARRCRLIVLQLDATELAAVACVTGRGIVFVVLDPTIASTELEQRMIGVAEALVESETRFTARSRAAGRR
jgi:hypothetical protein